MKNKVNSVVALIPARAGSKGVPNKNVRKLGNHPLIEWSIAACKSAGLINRTIVSTDSEEYARMAMAMGAEAPFLRPDKFSGDFSTDYEFITHCLDFLQTESIEPDYVLHIRPTTPFRDPKKIEEALLTFQNNSNSTALRSVHPMPESAYKSFEISQTGQLKCLGLNNTDIDVANNARQEFPKTYIANGYVDVLFTPHIRKFKLLHGKNVLPFITQVTNEVDTEDDFKRLEWELSQYPEHKNKLFG